MEEAVASHPPRRARLHASADRAADRRQFRRRRDDATQPGVVAGRRCPGPRDAGRRPRRGGRPDHPLPYGPPGPPHAGRRRAARLGRVAIHRPRQRRQRVAQYPPARVAHPLGGSVHMARRGSPTPGRLPQRHHLARRRTRRGRHHPRALGRGPPRGPRGRLAVAAGPGHPHRHAAPACRGGPEHGQGAGRRDGARVDSASGRHGSALERVPGAVGGRPGPGDPPARRAPGPNPGFAGLGGHAGGAVPHGVGASNPYRRFVDARPSRNLDGSDRLARHDRRDAQPTGGRWIVCGRRTARAVRPRSRAPQHPSAKIAR